MTTSSKRVLHLDIETYCTEDLKSCGVYRYAAAPSLELLLLSYCVDDDPVQALDLRDSAAVEEMKSMLTDETIIKAAHNAVFEQQCLSHLWRLELDPTQWVDTMALANFAGLPPSLAALTDVLRLKDHGKLAIGTELIRFFCKPQKGGRRNLPEDDADRWATFVEYNKRDVEAEREVYRRLISARQTPTEREVQLLDARINDRGVRVDRELAERAVLMSDEITTRAMIELRALTGLENPASVAQFKQYLTRRGIPVKSFTKKQAEELLATLDDKDIRRAIELRLSVSKAAVKKYAAVLRSVCSDDRVKGMFSYYGANHTGRWAGRLVQLQNLRRNSLPDLDAAREVAKRGDLEGLKLGWEEYDPAEILGQLIRTVFIPSKGRKFIVADFSAIEARVLAWLARETWRQKAFAAGEDIYKSSYSQAFGVPVAEITKEMRQKGKIMELACIAEGQLVLTDHGAIPIERVSMTDRVWDGEAFVWHEGVVFRGVKEVITYDGLTATPDHLVWVDDPNETELVVLPLGLAQASGLRLARTGSVLCLPAAEPVAPGAKKRVYDIRNAGPLHRYTVSGRLVHNCGYGGAVGALKAFGADKLGLSDAELRGLVDRWRDSSRHIVEYWRGVDSAMRRAIDGEDVRLDRDMRVTPRDGAVYITLPSGRALAYQEAGITDGEITYSGVEMLSRKWGRIKTHGGRLVENITQAVARDCLAEAMLRLDRAGYDIVAHVHDEVIIDAPMDTRAEDVERSMGETIDWAPELVLTAKGYEGQYYYKD